MQCHVADLAFLAVGAGNVTYHTADADHLVMRNDCGKAALHPVMGFIVITAAYAEADDFESAVKWQEEAIRLDTGAFAVDFQKRLRLFKAGKAYREGVAAYKDPAAEVSTEAEIPNAVKAETNKPATTDEATTQEETVQP